MMMCMGFLNRWGIHMHHLFLNSPFRQTHESLAMVLVLIINYAQQQHRIDRNNVSKPKKQYETLQLAQGSVSGPRAYLASND